MLEKYTALYSDLDIEYNQEMSGHYEDLSFKSDECEIIAGLKDSRISGFWRPVVAVGSDKALKFHIERLYDTCPNIYYMDFLIDGRLSVISQFLLRHGHTARPYYTQIINLKKSEEQLHADLRKSYKSLICKHSVFRYDGKGKAVSLLKELHDRQRRRSTRSNKTWLIQKNMIDEDEAFITAPVDFKAASLTYYNGKCAYYACGASEKNYNSHEVIWSAILIAKREGCIFFEMGEQVFSGDEKLVNISKFKRGFGGTTQTRLILEKL